MGGQNKVVFFGGVGGRTLLFSATKKLHFRLERVEILHSVASVPGSRMCKALHFLMEVETGWLCSVFVCILYFWHDMPLLSGNRRFGADVNRCYFFNQELKRGETKLNTHHVCSRAEFLGLH